MITYATSPSAPAAILEVNSTTVTSVPNLLHTEPCQMSTTPSRTLLTNSRPITPPPMTIMDLGIELKDSAPVDETMLFSSIYNTVS
jgi:hypothetical protein